MQQNSGVVMTGTQISYYFLCTRKLWFFCNSINMEYNSEDVAMGRFISETTYEREKHEIQIDDIVLDFYDAKTKTIHEVKKSNKMEETHIWQVKYYISVLESKGIEGVKGRIDYPKLRETLEVELSDKDRTKIIEIKEDITRIITGNIPKEINKPFCKKCAYYDLCYI